MLAGTPAMPISGHTWRLSVPVVAPAATAAVYVYEKNESAVPPGVSMGLNRLNRERKIVATMFEVDTVDGSGQVPDQYKPAVEAARQKSIPALVVLSGSTVLKVVEAPKTEHEVVRAVP